MYLNVINFQKQIEYISLVILRNKIEKHVVFNFVNVVQINEHVNYKEIITQLYIFNFMSQL